MNGGCSVNDSLIAIPINAMGIYVMKMFVTFVTRVITEDQKIRHPKCDSKSVFAFCHVAVLVPVTVVYWPSLLLHPI